MEYFLFGAPCFRHIHHHCYGKYRYVDLYTLTFILILKRFGFVSVFPHQNQFTAEHDRECSTVLYLCSLTSVAWEFLPKLSRALAGIWTRVSSSGSSCSVQAILQGHRMVCACSRESNIYTIRVFMPRPCRDLDPGLKLRKLVFCPSYTTRASDGLCL